LELGLVERDNMAVNTQWRCNLISTDASRALASSRALLALEHTAAGSAQLLTGSRGEGSMAAYQREGGTERGRWRGQAPSERWRRKGPREIHLGPCREPGCAAAARWGGRERRRELSARHGEERDGGWELVEIRAER